MTSNYKLTLIEGERDSEFYADMGPFFASATVAKELGEPLYDEEGSLWVLAKKSKKLVGWAVFRIRKDGDAMFDWSYVVPEHRQKGLWTQMYEFKMGHLQEIGISCVHTATCDVDMQEAFKKFGWQVRREKGRWVFYDKELGSP